jgi:hypothetical protein
MKKGFRTGHALLPYQKHRARRLGILGESVLRSRRRSQNNRCVNLGLPCTNNMNLHQLDIIHGPPYEVAGFANLMEL